MIHLAMLRAAFYGSENAERFVLRPDALVERVCLCNRNDAVVLAMQDENGAGDLVGDALEGELLCPLERGLVVRCAGDPAKLEGRTRRRARVFRGVTGDEVVQVPVHRAEGDAGGIAF